MAESVVVGVRVTKELRDALEARAKEEGVSVPDLIRAAIPPTETLRKSAIPTPSAPKGEVHEKKENLVGKDMSGQSAMVPTTVDPSQPRPKTTISPGSRNL